MFTTRKDLVSAQMQLDVDPYDRSAPPEKPGLPKRLIGGKAPPDLPPPLTFPRDVAEALAALARPSARLQSTSRTKLKPGATKIGGLPDLPPGTDWPTRPARPNIAKAFADAAEVETDAEIAKSDTYCGGPEAYNTPANAGIMATAPEWTLLLQIDTDEKADIMFGDSGKLYVWIKQADLAALACEKAWVIVQCY